MFQAQRAQFAGLLERFDERWPGARRRAAGISLSLGLEIGIVLLLLTLGQAVHRQAEMSDKFVSISFAPDNGKAKEERENARDEQRAAREAGLTVEVVADVEAGVRRALALPGPAPHVLVCGGLHFAGEHCSVEAQGFMEGGCESGELAAQAVLQQRGIARAA